MKNRKDVKVLLLQFRKAEKMRLQEKDCFLRFGKLDPKQITTKYILEEKVDVSELEEYDCLFLGGTGDFEVKEIESKYPESFRRLTEIALAARSVDMPVLTVCLQTWAHIFDGEVSTAEVQELGSLNIYLTEEGRTDPLFRELPVVFKAMVGHKDYVSRLPEGATLLAVSQHCPVHCYRIGQKEYFFQFHLELDRQALIERVEFYKDRYVGEGEEEYKKFVEELEEVNFSTKLVSMFIDRIVLGQLQEKEALGPVNFWAGEFKGV